MIGLILALLLGGDWEYRPGIGFVNRSTMEKKTPEEFFSYGVSLARARETEEAVEVFALLMTHAPDPALRERAHFKKAEALYSGSEFGAAYREFNEFLIRYPESKLADSTSDRPGAKELEMDAALLLAREGDVDTFLGLPILRTSKTGIEYLHAALQRYPREDFSDNYYFKLGAFLTEDEKYDEAEVEFKFILEEYKETESAPLALLMLGELGLKRFDSIDYDIKGLKNARRYYERFIEEAPIFAGISKEIKAIIEKELPGAREKVAFINETEAEKEYEIGEYYRRKEFTTSAGVYYRSILRNYPRTTWAEKVRERLAEPEMAKVRDRLAQEELERADQERRKGDAKAAEASCRTVLRDYPKTPWAAKAEALLKDLGK